jgi:hypothetical protein
VHNTYEQVNGPRRRQLERQLERVDLVRQGRGLGTGHGEDDPVLREVSSW